MMVENRVERDERECGEQHNVDEEHNFNEHFFCNGGVFDGSKREVGNDGKNANCNF